jgi:hypothetical protein
MAKVSPAQVHNGTPPGNSRPPQPWAANSITQPNAACTGVMQEAHARAGGI